eukprot:m.100108 g.100108  ORF g.100108 m.100108 type:complete len:1031 (+) comp15377_c0_seq1:192-3284(+)
MAATGSMWEAYQNLNQLVQQASPARESATAASDRLVQRAAATLHVSRHEFLFFSEFWSRQGDLSEQVFALSRNADDNLKVTSACKALAGDGKAAPIAARPGYPECWLSAEEVQVTSLMAELYNLNEVTSAGLVVDALRTRRPMLQRLTPLAKAVYLYHDARTALLTALLQLLIASNGRSFAQTFSDSFHRMAVKFLGQFDSMTAVLISAAAQANPTEELAHLQQAGAIGADTLPLLTKVIQAEHDSLADCIFATAAQLPVSVTNPVGRSQALPRMAAEDALAIVMVLQRRTDGLPPTAPLDSVSVALLFSVFHALDLVVDMERFQIAETNPLSKDHRMKEVLEADWSNAALKRLVLLVWAIMSNEEDSRNDVFFTASQGSGVFSLITNQVLCTEAFEQTHSFFPFYMEALDKLLFRVLDDWDLVTKIKSKGEDALRTAPAGQPIVCDYVDLQHMVAALYSRTLDAEEDSCWLVTLAAGSWERFVRLCGDQLPLQFYVPYVEMLTGLATPHGGARQVCEWLSDAPMGYRSAYVSWHSLFEAVHSYAEMFRQQNMHMSGMPGMMDLPAQPREMDPEAVAMLEAFLKLLQRVAQCDVDARIMLLENRDWRTLAGLFGLLSASVPPRLKAALLSAIQAFSLSPDAAATIWRQIDAYELIVGITPGKVANHGIKQELEEREAANKQYPETIAFLSLLDTIADSAPPDLGVANPQRVPGFEPYTWFARDSVLLKFNFRGYLDPGDKWLVAASALRVLNRVLSAYKPNPNDFHQQPGAVAVGPEGHHRLCGVDLAGFKLIQSLLMEPQHETLGVLFYILRCAMDAPTQLNAKQKESYRESMLLSLQIIEMLFEKQELFLASGLVQTRVEQVLLEVSNNNKKVEGSRGTRNCCSSTLTASFSRLTTRRQMRVRPRDPGAFICWRILCRLSLSRNKRCMPCGFFGGSASHCLPSITWQPFSVGSQSPTDRTRCALFPNGWKTFEENPIPPTAPTTMSPANRMRSFATPSALASCTFWCTTLGDQHPTWHTCCSVSQSTP